MTSRFAPESGKEDPIKKMVGEAAADHIKDGMVVGLGTGSTVYYTIRKLGRRMKEEGLDIIGIPTSLDTRNHALSLGIPLTDLSEHPVIDLTIDGADEVDPALNLIKGLGGALLLEKIVASASKEEIIVVGEKKMVIRLGRGKLPVETLRFGHRSTMNKLNDLWMNPSLRYTSNNTPFITDNNCYIYDCLPGGLDDPIETERMINTIPGVLENGLFINLANLAIVGTESGMKTVGPGEWIF